MSTNRILLFLTTAFLCAGATALAQKTVPLTISVSGLPGDDLTGQEISLIQADYDVSYGNLTLNSNGKCFQQVYPGNHRLSILREGFMPVEESFFIPEDSEAFATDITLTEATRTPFALTPTVVHDIFTGHDDVCLTWNTEPPAFFDDFESYDPFSISFGEWTGIDADGEAAAAMLGSYPNRGVSQYAQIINPMTVVPTWWYDYPILRPWSGHQYVGFVRTESGRANNDWLISPEFTPGEDHVLSFMAKAADQFEERFMVYVTEKTDNPAPEDFIRIDKGNYEGADHKGWKEYSYDLSAWKGKPLKFAIRYVSNYNLHRSFMLMVDDVYVGQKKSVERRAAMRAARSAANPYESFALFLDGEQVATTEGYSYTFTALAPGNHTLGVQALYRASKSETAEIPVDIPDAGYASLTLRLTADSNLTPDGQTLTLTSMESDQAWTLIPEDGIVRILSLPLGRYLLTSDEGAFEALVREFEVSRDLEMDLEFKDRIITPYNITATETPEGIVVRWNQELLFSDSFEEYPDFASGEFGEWRTIDRDRLPVYPIGLGSTSNIVSFPGSGTASNPLPVPPMVFNPWETTPPMLPTDIAIAAPSGDKSVIFFSPQNDQADKWLISPELDIRDNYEIRFLAKAYASLYPEHFELLLSDGGAEPEDFTLFAEIRNVVSATWGAYSADLSEYAGRRIRVALRYRSTDAFLAQVDDFELGPKGGEIPFVDFGNIIRFEIFIDGLLAGESATPTFLLTDLAEGTHTVGIRALYKSGVSPTAEFSFGVSSIQSVGAEKISASPLIFDLTGKRAGEESRGILIREGKKQLINK